MQISLDDLFVSFPIFALPPHVYINTNIPRMVIVVETYVNEAKGKPIRNPIRFENPLPRLQCIIV